MRTYPSVIALATMTWLCLLQSTARAEIFTALVDLQRLLYAESSLSNDLRNYIQAEEKRLETLKRIADDYEDHSRNALEDVDKHLANPVNAFLLVKRFTTDWERVESIIRNNTSESFLSGISNNILSFFPDGEDLTGAATALLRLQDTYALSTSKLAKGDIAGVKSSPTLSAADCFELGRLSYNNQDYYHTVLWMQEALDHWEEEAPENKTIEKAEILDYLAYSMSMQGNVELALNLTNEWLKMEPDHQRAQNNKRYYEQILAEQAAERRKGDEGDAPPEFKNPRVLNDYRASEEFAQYEALCRGEDIMAYKDAHKLTCEYAKPHPFFYLRPLKQETMYLQPHIRIYHDILVDSEISKVKELASPRLARSGVFTRDDQESIYSQDRTSKSAWLRDAEDPLIADISGKVEKITGLSMETAEELQVVNYGIGGHYEPHYDFARKREAGSFEEWRGNRIATPLFYKDEQAAFDPRAGNRIATCLYYMSDVEAGGATVFPQIGVKLWPVKGTLAFWHNLLSSGEGDYSTRHAACPVLTGSKWVCNKWIHERSQEFRRPCSTNPNL